MITEQTIIKPSYRCFIELDEKNEYDKKLLTNIKSFKSEFIPYLGKNEFSFWWENPHIYNFEEGYSKFEYKRDFKIDSLFIKTNPLKGEIVQPRITWARTQKEDFFLYFERLPIGFNETLYQYELADFSYTNNIFGKDTTIKDLYQISKQNEIIQLF